MSTIRQRGVSQQSGDLASPPVLLCGWLSYGAKGKSLDVPKLQVHYFQNGLGKIVPKAILTLTLRGEGVSCADGTWILCVSREILEARLLENRVALCLWALPSPCLWGSPWQRVVRVCPFHPWACPHVMQALSACLWLCGHLSRLGHLGQASGGQLKYGHACCELPVLHTLCGGRGTIRLSRPLRL